MATLHVRQNEGWGKMVFLVFLVFPAFFLLFCAIALVFLVFPGNTVWPGPPPLTQTRGRQIAGLGAGGGQDPTRRPSWTLNVPGLIQELGQPQLEMDPGRPLELQPCPPHLALSTLILGVLWLYGSRALLAYVLEGLSLRGPCHSMHS